MHLCIIYHAHLLYTVFVLPISHFNYISHCIDRNPTWLFVFFFLVHLWPWFLSAHTKATTAFPNCKEISNKKNRVEENNIQPNSSVMNNRGWEQRANVPNSLQNGELGTVGSSKWRCWNIKIISAQKSCNMVSANCRQHTDVYLAQLVCEAS